MELSFEVFPPKISDGIEKIYDCLESFSKYNPEFISVTCSAGVSQKGLTSEVCEYIQKEYGIKAVSHLTCAGATKSDIENELERLKNMGVNTILALRGDITPEKHVVDFSHATNLMEKINEFGGFNLAGACYPEGHFESGSKYCDLTTLKMKYDLGARYFISQLFLDNKDFLNMKDEGTKCCKDATFCAGIMPITSVKSVYRVITLSGAKLSKGMKDILAKYKDTPTDMRKAGIEYAINQIRNLVKEGCENIHLYTMCQKKTTAEIYDGIKDLLK